MNRVCTLKGANYPVFFLDPTKIPFRKATKPNQNSTGPLGSAVLECYWKGAKKSLLGIAGGAI